jgi:hypothetical protein
MRIVLLIKMLELNPFHGHNGGAVTKECAAHLI